VAVFKDGYALVVKSATGVADAKGRVFTEEVPDAAVLGCFWASTQSGEIVAMRAELATDEREERRETVCVTLADILRANADARVSLTLRDQNATVIEGRVLRLLETAPIEPEPAPGAPPVRVRRDEAGTVRTPLVSRGGEFVAMEVNGGQQIVPVSEIRSIAGEKLETRTAHPEKVSVTTKRLSFDLGAAAAGKTQTLRIMYFTPGMRWIPTYRLGMNADNKSGVLALQGELLNELENFQDVTMDMVVGVPNFKFRGTVSPLVLERTLRNALVSAAPDIMGRGQLSNAYFAQRAGEWREGQDELRVTGADLAPELSAGGEQDLFVYSHPGFELFTGERASVPVLKQDVTFDHLYTLDIAAVRDPRQSGTAQYACKTPGGSDVIPPPGGETRLSVNQVWHQIELKNGSNTPWTTGAALVMAGGESVGTSGASGRVIPVAQELLRYTPAGGKVLLPLTVAVDMRAELAEEELSREENALRRNGTSYTLVRAKSTITLASSRNEASATRVKLSLGGKASEASDGAKVVMTGHFSPDWGNNDPGPVNNHTDLTWQVELKPGETRVLTVEFSYYTY
jgi:hypothetical protein